MLKILRNLLKKKSIKNESDSVYANMTCGDVFYDMTLNDIQDNINDNEEKYELNCAEKNVYSARSNDEYNYRTEENSYIKVREKNKIYSEGSYIVGQNGLLPGLYYAWDNYEVFIGRNKSFSTGSWKCDDGYLQLITGKKVVIKSGKITFVDNIIYTYRLCHIT